MSTESRPPDFFERLYAENPDPWDFQTSAYEHEKYQTTMAMLGGRHFENAFEAGCSIGVLTKQLAPRCSRLLAADVADTALAAAVARCRGLDHVVFRNLRLPAEWPAGERFDLMMFSEILYFMNRADIENTATRAREALASGGIVMLVNYTETIDEPFSGDQAAACFVAASGLSHVAQQSRPKYRIDILAREA